MKILMLTPYLPYPPSSGGQIRTINLIKHLSENHEITLVSLYKSAHQKAYSKNLDKYCKAIYLCKRAEKPWQLKNILKSIFSLLPFLIVRNYSDEAHVIIKKLLATEKFDVIHAETFYIMPHIPQTSIPILLVEQTIEYKVYQHFISNLFFPIKMALSLDILKLKYWEHFYWKKARTVAAVSELDQKIIKEEQPSLHPVMFPNGAGDEMFVDKIEPKDITNPKLLFMGNFAWLQNVEAADYLIDNVMPDLIKSQPNVKLIIAGQDVKTKIHKNLSKNIEIVDIPPDDIQTVKNLYNESTIFLAPIFGPGGTRLKVLASMAAGLPVISTYTGVEGLGVKNKKHALIANTPEEFVENIINLLNNNSLYEDMRHSAYNLVKKEFSWSEIAKNLEKEYRRIKKNDQSS